MKDYATSTADRYNYTTMPSLLDQLRDLRRSVRRLLWLNGVSWVIAGWLCGVLLIGLGDWLWHFDDRGLRAGLLATLLAAAGWLAWRRLIAPLRRPLSNLELSSHLESHFPKLRSRLATAVEFLERDVSPNVGSPELQRRLIEQTTAEVRSLDFAEVLDRRETQRAAFALAILFFVGLLLFAVNSVAASTAMRRLLWPLADHPWPKSVELQLVRGDLSAVVASPDKPLRNVQGQPLDLFVVNTRGPLPQPVLVEFRQRGRMPQSEPLRIATLRDATDQSREVAAIRLPIEEGEVEFRAVGGDDREMPWHELRIVPPPKLESFRVEIVPPSYTGEAATMLPEGATQVRATVGSRLKIAAKTNRPVTRAVADAASIGHEISLAPNGRDVRWQFAVLQSGTVTQQLSLVDRDGFENSSALRLEVVGIADLPPVVALEQPATDQLVTANATVRLAATARDERRLRDVALEYSVGWDKLASSAGPPTTPPVGRRGEAPLVPPYEATQSTSTSSTNWQVENLPHEDGAREAVVRLAWLLSKLDPKVGDRIALRVVASDHCDVGEPRVGRSAMRTLTVVSPEEKQSEIAHRLDLLLHDLETLAAKQSQTKDQTELLRVQAEKGAEFRPQDRDSLKRVELDQRQIGSRLTGRGDGVIARAHELLSQLEDNQLNDSVTRERLTHIAEAVESLSRQTLPTLESLLGRVVKDSGGSQPLAGVAAAFPEIVVRQADVLSTLTDLIRDLTQWRDRRDLAREIGELAKTQETLNRDTSELAPQTLGKSASQLPSQQQADVAKLADRQSRQAERIEQLRQRLAQSSRDGREGEAPAEPKRDVPNDGSAGASPSQDIAAHEVATELDQHALAAKAREAAREVAENNLGQAGRTQQQLAEELQALADKLAQTPTSNSDAAVRELRELEGQLDSLTQQQRKLLEETRTAAEKSDSLTPDELAEQAKVLRDRQAETKRTAEELAAKLKATRADESREALRRASRHMQQAESQLADKQLARGADEEQTALDDLEQAGRELAAARRAAQQQELAEKTNALAEAVRELVARQKTVVDETERLSVEQQKAGKWTRPLSKAALNLGDAEQELAVSTEELSKSLSDIEAVRLTLDRATSDLAAAASRLREKQLDEETARREQSALRALQSLANALAPPPDQPPNEETAQQPPEGQEKNAQPEEPVPPVAQLKLLRELQADVGDRTRSAEARAPKAPPSDDEAKLREAEMRQLAADQQSVHEATSRLLERVPVAEPMKDPPPTTPDETEPRETALSAMQQSFDNLRSAETGKPTQAAQQTAVASLDKLLKSWQQRAAQQQSLARSGQQGPMPDKTPNENSSTTDGTGGKPTGRDSAQARNSSDREQAGSDALAELRRQRQLREAVWGHLPSALREKMLNLPHDKTLPKYSEHIRRYYESLAEQE